MKSRSIAVITWRSMRAVRCLRSVAAPRSISSASSSPSGRRCLHATTHTARISRDSRQRHFTFKQRTPPPVSNSREQEHYFVLKEPHPFIFATRRGKHGNNILRRYVYPACDAAGVPRANWLTDVSPNLFHLVP